MAITLNDNIYQMYHLQQSTQASSVSNNSVVGENPIATNRQEETPQEYHRRKMGVMAGTAIGIATSLAILSQFDKNRKYSLSLKKIFNTPLKDTYLGSVKYKSKEVIGTGIGSCLGGLIGGMLFDKRGYNLKEKSQEGVVQLVNISLPIAFVEGLSTVGEKIGDAMKGWASKGGKVREIISKTPTVAGSVAGLLAGVYLGNALSQKINEKVFHKQEKDRPVKLSDFSAHVDDICLAATFVAENNPMTRGISRIIPLALGVAGYEVGNKSKNPKED